MNRLTVLQRDGACLREGSPGGPRTASGMGTDGEEPATVASTARIRRSACATTPASPPLADLVTRADTRKEVSAARRWSFTAALEAAQGEANVRRGEADPGADRGNHGREAWMRRSGWAALPNRGDPHVCHDRAVKRHGDSFVSG